MYFLLQNRPLACWHMNLHFNVLVPFVFSCSLLLLVAVMTFWRWLVILAELCCPLLYCRWNDEGLRLFHVLWGLHVHVFFFLHEMQTIVIGDLVVWASCQSVSLSVMRVTVIIHLPNGSTLMQPSLHYCSHLLSCAHWY